VAPPPRERSGTGRSRRPRAARRREQHLYALLLDQLAEVDDSRLVAGEERREAIGVPVVGQALLGVAGVRRVAARLLDERGERLVARAQRELVHVDARRHLEDAVHVADDLLEDRADVLGTDVRRLGLRERLRTPPFELRTPPHRVLELGPVCLHAEGDAGRSAHGRAHQHVVREHDVRREQVAEDGGVRVDVGGLLGVGEVLEELRVQAGVAVHDEHGQKPGRQVDGHDARTGEVVLLRRALLAHDDDVVPGAAPLARDRLRVDVRPGPREQVPVPEQDAHRARRPPGRYARWK
jgi:hypothetical protein